MLGNNTTGLGNVATAGQPPQSTGGGSPPTLEFLSEIFDRGLDEPVPAVPNTLVGTYISMFLDGAAQGIFAYQEPASDGSDFDAHPLYRGQRHFTGALGASVGLVAEFETKYDNQNGSNNQGGVRIDSLIVDGANNRTVIDRHTEQMLRASAQGYFPAVSSTEPTTTLYWDLLNRRGGGSTSRIQMNSDGAHYRSVLLPNSGGPNAYYAGMLDAFGFSGLPQIGSEVIYDCVAVFLGGYDWPGNHEIGHASAVFDAENSGSGQYAGHLEWWVRSTLGGPLVLALALYEDELITAGALTVGGAATIGGDLTVAGGIVGEWQETALVAPGQDLTIPLANVADATYEWEAYIIFADTDQSVTLQFNHSEADFENLLRGFAVPFPGGTATPFNDSWANSELTSNVGGAADMTCRLTRGLISQRAGEAPYVTVEGYEDFNTTDRAIWTRQMRRTTTAAITNTTIHATDATGMDTGSWYRIRRIT